MGEWAKYVRDSYQEAIAINPTIDGELRSALKTHERVPLFVENLAKQIDSIQNTRIRRGKKALLHKTIKDAVYDMTEVFIQSVKIEAKQRYETEAARIVRERAEQNKKDLEATIEGKASGEYAELGVTFGETKTESISGQA